MNKAYHMTIAGCERDLPICPLNEKLSIGAFVIFGDCELTVACYYNMKEDMAYEH